MGWIEIPQIKFHLSEIDTKGVLIILNEVFQQTFLIPPVYWKVPRANENEPWESRPVSRECVNVQGTKQGYRAANGEGRMDLQTRMCTVTAWCKDWAETGGLSQLSEDWFNTSANLIWSWYLPNTLLSPVNEMTIFAYETLLRLNTWVCEKWMQCTAKQQESCAQIQRWLKQRERVEAAEVVTVIFAFFQVAS